MKVVPEIEKHRPQNVDSVSLGTTSMNLKFKLMVMRPHKVPELPQPVFLDQPSVGNRCGPTGQRHSGHTPHPLCTGCEVEGHPAQETLLQPPSPHSIGASVPRLVSSAQKGASLWTLMTVPRRNAPSQQLAKSFSRTGGEVPMDGLHSIFKL